MNIYLNTCVDLTILYCAGEGCDIESVLCPIPVHVTDGWMDERCFRPLFCTIKAELGRCLNQSKTFSPIFSACWLVQFQRLSESR